MDVTVPVAQSPLFEVGSVEFRVGSCHITEGQGQIPWEGLRGEPGRKGRSSVSEVPLDAGRGVSTCVKSLVLPKLLR